MKQKIIILVVIVILLTTAGIYQGFFKKEKPRFTLAEVIRRNISQEISATGQVKKGEEITLSFKNAGRIEKIYVKVGETVKKGDILAKQDTTQLKIQLEDARANLSTALAKLNKLLAGASPEEIQIAKTAVENAKNSLEQAKQNLEDTKRSAAENLRSAYEDASDVLDDVYLKTGNVFEVVDSIQKNYFTANDQEGIRVRENRDEIEKAVSQLKTSLEGVKADSSQKNIDLTLSETKNYLDKILSSLRFIREVCESVTYRNIVSAADKTSLDEQKSYVAGALNAVTNSQQTISLVRATGESNINNAKAQISAAEDSLKAAQDKLSLLLTPNKKDIDSYRAQVQQLQAQVELLEGQIEEANLKSSVEGEITKISKKEGETVRPMRADIVITLIPAELWQIEVGIPEADIGKIDPEDPCKIILDDFPKIEFSGKVIGIEPAETATSGAVYYKTKISLEAKEFEEKLNPGMTANVKIIADFRENVLIIPQKAVLEKDGKKIVRVAKDGNFEEVEIQTGLQGSEGEIEITSGLKEGDKIILF